MRPNCMFLIRIVRFMFVCLVGLMMICYIYIMYIYIIYGFLIMNIVMFYVWGAPSIINPG